mmetsp:Transcript_9996/g.30828  ORF Transcript_9996/g.30828 Transcript_9996/m.30828 type:complete len:565 (-) Transcript_9996:20-1714(-)
MDASSSDDEPVVAVEDDAPAPEETDLVWETLTDDGGVKKATTRKALGVPKYPDPGMELKVHYTGIVPGEAEPFDCSRKRKTAFTFELGGGSVISGWDVAFQRVAIGERAIVEVAPAYGYGADGHPPTIPPNATLRFDVELLKATKKKRDLHMMKEDEKLAAAAGHKQKGLDLYAAKDWKAARREFAEAIHYCDAQAYSRGDDVMPAEVGAIYLSAHLNASQCALHTKEWPAAAAYATRAVRADPANVKGLYRRGVARSNMGLLEEARDDLREAARLDPKNRAVRAEWTKLKQKFADQAKAQKQTFAGGFDKVSLFGDKPSNLLDPSKTENPYAFFRLRAVPRGGDETTLEPFDGVVAVRVFSDACPKTAKNFLALVEGSRRGRALGSKLAYAGTPIHRVAKDFMIQGGDVHRKDGTSGESIYGKTFADEHLKLPFDAPGRLAMANRGPDANHSQFFVTCDSAPHCDGKYVVFGELVAGMSVVKRVAALAVDDNDAPKDFSVVIAECGELEREKAEAMIEEEAAKQRAIDDMKRRAAEADARDAGKKLAEADTWDEGAPAPEAAD